jgi:signal transduction histidine kinase
LLCVCILFVVLHLPAFLFMLIILCCFCFLFLKSFTCLFVLLLLFIFVCSFVCFFNFVYFFFWYICLDVFLILIFRYLNTYLYNNKTNKQVKLFKKRKQKQHKIISINKKAGKCKTTNKIHTHINMYDIIPCGSPLLLI